ncbi:M28 family peptidase [Paenibacillus sp. SC116]|uniref:M28 family peptidase n=1 Tax=Paenibacillus sp. SC116 TaxID=2968986 RepID=UPI00215A9203|nr:M28 family peptidase [Paenibacillus sp. SC116]MCR8842479.1 M28 family peptidase [Paenibacillus sp. SC116]
MRSETVVQTHLNRIHPAIKMLCALAGIGTLVILTLFLQKPPEPKASDVPIQEFSSARAMEYIKVIAAEPHPTGSAAIEKVRQYLVDQLKQLDINPKIDTFNGFLETSYFKGNIELHNIIGIVKGTGNGKAIMLSAHYDSVDTAPGANDNGAAVAALLETARALKSGPQLKNDVWFVFTDGEEKGLLGAEVFWRNEQHRQQIGMIANFEARGSKGSSMMFQTSHQNGKLIREFAESAPSPLANSFMGDLYKKLPNDTDFTVSLKHDIPGLNFAYIDGWEKYHSSEDNIDHVDPFSLQHHGENALYIAKHFGNLDLENLKTSNEIYFSFFGKVIHFPESFIGMATLFLAILFTTIVIWGFKKRLLRFKGMSVSFLYILLSILLSALVAAGLCFGIYQLWAERMTLTNDYTHDSILYNFTFLLVALVVNSFLLPIFKKKFNDLEMMLTGMLLFLLLMLASALYLPGASYLLALPLLIHCLIIGFALTRQDTLAFLNHPLVIAALAFLPIVLFTTVFHLLFIGLPPVVNVAGAIILSLLLAILHTLNNWLVGARRIYVTIILISIVTLISTGLIRSLYL